MSGPVVLYTLISLMVLLWSANFIIGKVALREFPPFLLGALRIGLAGVFLAPVYWLKTRAGGAQLRSPPDLVLLVFLAVCSVANQIIFLVGLNRTSVAHSSLIIGMGPIFVLLIAASLGLERITPRKIAGMAIALAGVAVLAHQASSDPAPGSTKTQFTLEGDALIALGSLTFSLFAVFGKKAAARYSSVVVNGFAYVAGGIALAPLVMWQARDFPFARISVAGWASLIYMALFPSAVCYMIYYYALSHIAASRVSAFIYLQPLIAILMAVAFLGERITAPVVAGGTVIFTGVYLAERD